MVRHASADPHLITKSEDLAEFCGTLAHAPFITIDTEFLRETTYYPLLCVVQMASAEDAVVIDTLAEGKVLRGTSEFAGLRGSFIETWDLEEVNADGSTRGRILLSTITVGDN